MDGPALPEPGAAPNQRNPPLAPSQELAYRNKCIQLKKRLAEIEANNESTRRRISAEKERVQKQRLLRAILLNQLREIMETPGKKFPPEELERMGIVINGDVDDEEHTSDARQRPEGEALLDDSSDNSDEDIPEPGDRPTRTRRQGPSYRGEAVMNSHPQQPNPSAYTPSSLPAIAPASAYSPAAGRESLLNSSFQTPGAPSGSPPTYTIHHPQTSHFVSDPRFPPSSPIHSRPQTISEVQPHSSQVTSAVRSLSSGSGMHSQSQPQAPIVSQGSPQQSHQAEPTNGYRPSSSSNVAQPVRPSPPYNQFCDHMRPQLEADNYPREHIQNRIDEEWRKLSPENRQLWDERYHDQMRDYEEQMDMWKRAQRRVGEAGPVGASTPVGAPASTPLGSAERRSAFR